MNNFCYCSDFHNESYGIFALGRFFFLQKIFDFLTSFFGGIFSHHSQGIIHLSLSFKRYFTCDHFSLSHGGLKIAMLANLGQLTRVIFPLLTGKRDLICHTSRSKLVQGSLYAISDLSIGAKFITLYLI